VGTLYTSCALATRRWKLEYYFEERTGRLFDRQRDPLGRHDLYADPAHRDRRDGLLRALLSWRGDLTDVEFRRGPARTLVTAPQAGVCGSPTAWVRACLTVFQCGCCCG
jgi:hypothetical protein